MPKRKMTLEDEASVAHAKSAAKKFSKGTFTASQTGARQLAEERKQRTAMHMLRQDIAGGTTAFEEGSVAKDPMRRRPKRTKGY